jgi:hypothetical protein
MATRIAASFANRRAPFVNIAGRCQTAPRVVDTLGKVTTADSHDVSGQPFAKHALLRIMCWVYALAKPARPQSFATSATVLLKSCYSVNGYGAYTAF